MRKSLYIGMVMCLLSGWTARAQRTVDLDFRQVTLNVVFNAIERQTGQPVYRQPLETDSMVVSVHSEKEEPGGVAACVGGNSLPSILVWRRLLCVER